MGLVIVGDGNERERLKKQVDATGLSDRLWLAGFQQDPATYFQAMDVFALSSLREGLPNVCWRHCRMG